MGGWIEQRQWEQQEERCGGKFRGTGRGAWLLAGGQLSRTEALMPVQGLAGVWWVVGFCMNVEVGCKQAAEAAGIPTPSRERLETAWQVTWKQRRLESLQNIQLITHKILL